MNGIVTIEEIKSHSTGHWFDPGSMRFFRSRLPQTGYRVDNKAYFISSEQFIGSNGIPAPRLYTIRVLDYETGEIDTLGEFNKLTKSEARTQLNKIIKTIS